MHVTYFVSGKAGGTGDGTAVTYRHERVRLYEERQRQARQVNDFVQEAPQRQKHLDGLNLFRPFGQTNPPPSVMLHPYSIDDLLDEMKRDS